MLKRKRKSPSICKVIYINQSIWEIFIIILRKPLTVYGMTDYYLHYKSMA